MTAPLDKQLLLDGIQEEMVMDKFRNASPKVGGFLKSFRSQPLQKTLTPNTLIRGPGNTGLPSSKGLGFPSDQVSVLLSRGSFGWDREQVGAVHHQS